MTRTNSKQRPETNKKKLKKLNTKIKSKTNSRCARSIKIQFCDKFVSACAEPKKTIYLNWFVNINGVYREFFAVFMCDYSVWRKKKLVHCPCAHLRTWTRSIDIQIIVGVNGFQCYKFPDHRTFTRPLYARWVLKKTYIIIRILSCWTRSAFAFSRNFDQRTVEIRRQRNKRFMWPNCVSTAHGTDGITNI